jgi:hypothetical protein
VFQDRALKFSVTFFGETIRVICYALYYKELWLLDPENEVITKPQNLRNYLPTDEAHIQEDLRPQFYALCNVKYQIHWPICLSCGTSAWFRVMASSCEASRLQSLHIAHSVGLLWKRHQSDAVTSTWQHTRITRDKIPCPQGDLNPQFQKSSGRKSTP